MSRNHSIRDQLDATFMRIQRIEESEMELKADFARYLCVQVSGYLDRSIRNVTTSYVGERAHPTIASYVSKTTSRLTNLRTEKIKEHLLKFDPTWKGRLDELLADEAEHAINSVVALRNKIAHGEPADITPARVTQYYEQVTLVVDELESLLLSRNNS